jgi:transcriptional regulator with XRE-family HTH domain
MTTKVNVMTQLMQTLCPYTGGLVRQARQEANVSVDKLAELTGVNVREVEAIECGRRAASHGWLVSADQALGAGGRLREEVRQCLTVHTDMVVTVPAQQSLCPYVGQLVRQARDEADVSLGRLAELTGLPVEEVDAVERGRRAVSAAWLRLADKVLGARGRLRAEAGECLIVHTGMVTDINDLHSKDGICAIRVPSGYLLADAA